MKKSFLVLLIINFLSASIVYASSQEGVGCGTYNKNEDGGCKDITFETNSFNCTDEDGICYKLQNLSKNFQIFNLNESNQQNEVIDNDNIWNEMTQEQYVELVYNLENIYKYFFEKFARNGYDNNHGLLKANIQEFGDGANSNYFKDEKYSELNFYNGADGNFNIMNILEVTAHEFMHIVTLYEIGNPTINYDARTINESISDIFGIFINYYITGELDFLMGDEISNNHNIDRNLCNPESVAYPEHYSNYYDMPNDEEMSYVNSGFIGIIFCHLIQGGINNTSLITTNPISLEKLEKIVYYALDNGFLNFLSSSSIDNYFLNFRDSVINTATVLSEQIDANITSSDINSITTAFNSVGITRDPEFWILPNTIYPGKASVVYPGGTVQMLFNITSKNNFSGTVKLTAKISSDFPGIFKLENTDSIFIKANETKQIVANLYLNANFVDDYIYYVNILGEDENSTIKYNSHDIPILATSNPIGLDVDPKSAYNGQEIVITGYNLDKTSSVKFKESSDNLIEAVITEKKLDQLKVVVPSSAIDGYLKINNRNTGNGDQYLIFDVERTPMILEVGNDKSYKTISSAYDALEDGDTILVDDGVYNEAVWINNSKDITIKSKNASSKTIIDGSNLQNYLAISNSQNISVEGFTFRNLSSDYLNPIYIKDSSTRISTNVFENTYVNNKDNYLSMFLLNINNSTLCDSSFRNEISNNIFINNIIANSNGNLIDIFNSTKTCNVDIYNNQISTNTSNYVLLNLAGNIAFYNNLIYKNISSNNILETDGYYGDFIILNNVVADNKLSSSDTKVLYKAIYLSANSQSSKFKNNIIYKNTGYAGIDFSYAILSYKNYTNNILNSNLKGNFYFDNDTKTYNPTEVKYIKDNNSVHSPLFESNKDYHLGPNSPAINSGNTNILDYTLYDLENKTRDDRPDLGVYEFFKKKGKNK